MTTEQKMAQFIPIARNTQTASPHTRLSVCAHAMRFLAAVTVFGASPASAADLLDCYRQAQSYDATLRIADAALRVGREAYPQGLAGLLPNLSAQLSSQDTGIGSLPSGRGVIRTNWDYGAGMFTVSLTQPLFRWAAWQTYRIGEIQVVQSEAIYAQARIDMMLRLAQAYFDVIYTEEALSFAQIQKVAIAEKVVLSRRNFEAGLATIVDSREAIARLDLAEATEIAARNDLAIKRLALNQITGQTHSKLAGIRAGLKLASLVPQNPEVWAEQAERASYVVKANEAAVQVASRNIQVSNAGHLPTLDLSASINRSNQTGTLVSTQGSLSVYRQVGLTLTVPIFAGLGVNSKVRQAVYQHEEALASLDQARRTAANAANEAYLNYVSGISQVAALEVAEGSNILAVAASKRSLEVGLRLNLDVLDAEQQLYRVRRDLVKARVDSILAGLKLRAAVGTLSDGDLQTVNALLVTSVSADSLASRTPNPGLFTPGPVP